VTGIGLKVTQNMTDQSKEPHNDYLRAYVETGLVGLAGYLGLLVALAVTAKRVVRAAKRGLERGVALGFAGVVAGFIAVSLVSNVISQVIFLWYFFALAAAAEAIIRHDGTLPEEDGRAENDPVIDVIPAHS
jgi:O-antigen ligase